MLNFKNSIDNNIHKHVEIKKLKQHSKVNSPILVIGNKLDLLYDNKIKSRCFNSVDFEKFLSTFKSTFYHETSCKNSIGNGNLLNINVN